MAMRFLTLDKGWLDRIHISSIINYTGDHQLKYQI